MNHRVEHLADGVTLYCGDCREILCALEWCDVLITDPVWPNCPPGLLVGWSDPEALWRSFWREVETMLGLPRRVVVVMRHDSDPRFLAPVPLPYARAVSLPYVMPGYIGRFLGGDEIAYYFGEPIPSKDGQRVVPGRAPSVQPDGRAANGHPCSRALAHFEFLTRWWSEPDELVLAPFMGSGTTGVAAVKLGRRFIGIEIEEKVFRHRLPENIGRFSAAGPFHRQASAGQARGACAMSLHNSPLRRGAGATAPRCVRFEPASPRAHRRADPVRLARA